MIYFMMQEKVALILYSDSQLMLAAAAWFHASPPEPVSSVFLESVKLEKPLIRL